MCHGQFGGCQGHLKAAKTDGTAPMVRIPMTAAYWLVRCTTRQLRHQFDHLSSLAATNAATAVPRRVVYITLLDASLIGVLSAVWCLKLRL